MILKISNNNSNSLNNYELFLDNSILLKMCYTALNALNLKGPN